MNISPKAMGLYDELEALHKTRESMAHASIYHGQYVDMACDLNAALQVESSMDFTEIRLTMFMAKRRANGAQGGAK